MERLEKGKLKECLLGAIKKKDSRGTQACGIVKDFDRFAGGDGVDMDTITHESNPLSIVSLPNNSLEGMKRRHALDNSNKKKESIHSISPDDAKKFTLLNSPSMSN